MMMTEIADDRNSVSTARRIALTYLGLSLVWIYAGDQLLMSIVSDPTELTRWQTIKGGLFVVLSTLLIFQLVRQSLHALHRKQSEVRRLVGLIKHSPVVAMTWHNSPGWPVTFSSENIAHWGYSREEFLSGKRRYADLIHPDDLPRVHADIAGYLAGDSDKDRYEYRLRHGDGRWIWLEAHIWLNRNATGKVTEINGVLLDISERKTTGDELRQAQFCIDESAVAIFNIAEDGHINNANRHACETLGYSAEELRTLTLPDIDPTLNYKKWQEERRKISASGSNTLESLHRRKDGSTFPVEITISHFVFEGEIIFFSFVRDITERQRLENNLKQHSLDLEQRNAELERFNYAVSHDLKTPLVTIGTFLGFLEQDLVRQDSEAIRTDIAYIRAASGQMVKLLDSLLHLSRIGRQVNLPVDIRFNDLVQEALLLVGGVMNQRDIKVIVPEVELQLNADRSLLLELWQNLIENAVKYMGSQPEPVIEIAVDRCAGDLVFYIRDNGIGIDPCFTEKIFGLFDQLDRQQEGSGLGLALVRRIVELYNGKIWVESDGPGCGSCFHFTLPWALKTT